ncbi:MAG: hypothetical protein L0216_02830 [Planctomycetales bacterium]|nr:hypothetical protein [Planctomycetales bacterium]
MGLAALAFAPRGGADDPPAPRASTETTPESRKAAQLGVSWLLQNQNTDGAMAGSWGCHKSGAPCTGITGLVGLAIMAGGSTPGRGPHREALRAALDWTLKVAESRGSGALIAASDSTQLGALYDHACATLFMAEALGMDRPPAAQAVQAMRRPGTHGAARPRDRLHAAVEKAVVALERFQKADGGFGIESSNLHVSAMAWLALRSASHAGIAGPRGDPGRVLPALEAYVRSCATDEGPFRMQPVARPRGGGAGLFLPTASALRILASAGRDQDEQVERAAASLKTRRLGEEWGGRVSEWDFCGAFLATEALLQGPRRRFDAWYPVVREDLVRLQNADGSWDVQYCLCCKAFSTALAVLVLESPKRLLPHLEL